LHEVERGETVRAIARAGDPDRALSALFAPRDARSDHFSLYAFNVELARVAEQVSEPDLGAIKLQWWREAIDKAAAGDATGHPVADAFGAVMRRRALAPERIAALIDAREFDIAPRIMPDRASLEAYLRDTAGTLFALSASILGARDSMVAPAAQAGGLAYGLTGLMRALPVHAASGRLYLPADALRRHRTAPEQMLAGETSQGLDAALAEFRAMAREALDEAQRHVAKLDAPARTAFLPLSLVNPYLAALEKSGRDPLRDIVGINPLYRLWRLARAL
jgi:15-cis-phytoene synthase